MNYPFLTVLNLISTIIFVCFGVFIFGLLLKKWSGIDWEKSFKIIGGYFLVSILIYFIYPYPLLSNLFEIQNLMIVDFIIYSLILFFVFYLIMEKMAGSGLKKSVAIFVLVVMITFPILGQVNNVTLRFATNFGPFQAEHEEIQSDIAVRGTEIEDDLYFRIGNLSKPIFFWQTGRLFEAIIMID